MYFAHQVYSRSKSGANQEQIILRSSMCFSKHVPCPESVANNLEKRHVCDQISDPKLSLESSLYEAFQL